MLDQSPEGKGSARFEKAPARLLDLGARRSALAGSLTLRPSRNFEASELVPECFLLYRFGA